MRYALGLVAAAALLPLLATSPGGTRAFADESTAPLASDSPAATAADEARKLVEEIAKKPGGRLPQMCSGGRIMNVSAPTFSPYMPARGNGAEIVAATNFARIRPLREAAIPAIVAALKETTDHLVKEEVAPSPDTRPVVCWKCKDLEQGHLLVMLIDLNAVEALPALLEMYEKLERPGCVLPVLDLLSTMTAILRQEGYKPLLGSSIESAYRSAITDRVTKPYANITDAKKLDEKQRKMIGMDPILKIARASKAYCEIPATKDMKERVVKWAKDFLAKTPEDKRRGAAGMEAWPIRR